MSTETFSTILTNQTLDKEVTDSDSSARFTGPLGPHDVLIAGTALSNKGILVTHNTKAFERIEGLQIEDWF